MQKLKIGIFIDQLVPGGVQKSAINEALELKKLGHKVTIYVLVRLSYHYQYEDLTKGLKVIFLSDFNPWPLRRAIRIPYFAFLTHLHILNPFFVKRYQKALEGVDFILSHGTTTCITAASITHKLKIPYMAFVYDPMIYILEKVYSQTPARFLFPILRPLTYRYERSFLTTAALVATSSKVHQDFIESKYYVKPSIINLGVAVSTQTIRKSMPTLTLLGLSRWQLAKNPSLFLWLAKKLPKAKILIAGSWTNPQEEAEFKRKIKKAKLGTRVKLVSPVSEKDLKKLASQSLVWIHPNFEAYGLGGLEMAVLGLPIIMPKGSGITELFVEGKHGFFPEEDSKEEFLKHVRFLLANPEKAASMGKDARRVAKSYTWKQHANDVDESISRYVRRKKILFINNAYVDTISTGGGDQFIIELVARAPKSVQVTIILPYPGYHHFRQTQLERENVRFIVLAGSLFDNIDKPIPIFLAYIIRAIQTLFLLPKLPQFTLIYTATDIISDSIPAFFYHKMNPSIPWITRFFHFVAPPLKREGNLWVNIGSYILQQLSVALIKSASEVMADNKQLVKPLQRKGIQTGKIAYHPGGVDTRQIGLLKKRADYLSDGLFVGRLSPHKGAFDAIDVWRRVVKKKPGAKLVMIGGGPLKMTQDIKERIRRVGLSKNIILTGFVNDREKVFSYFRSSRLLLFLDHEAGFGLVVAEAMAAGLPVVSYNLPIFGSVYKKGYVASPLRDIDSVSRYVLDLVSHKEKLRAISKEAMNEAKKYDWSISAEKFYQALKETSA